MIRFLQVIKFGWKHSAQMASQTSNNMLRRCGIFVDMLYCFFVYKMWTNQYLKENFCNLNDDERQKLGGGVIRKLVKKEMHGRKIFAKTGDF